MSDTSKTEDKTGKDDATATAAPQSATAETDEFTRLRTEHVIPDDADMPTDRDPADPRPLSQIIAEAGARDGQENNAASLRAAERESAMAYEKAGILGAPGSEVPAGAEAPPAPEGVRPASQAEAEDAGTT